MFLQPNTYIANPFNHRHSFLNRTAHFRTNYVTRNYPHSFRVPIMSHMKPLRILQPCSLLIHITLCYFSVYVLALPVIYSHSDPVCIFLFINNACSITLCNITCWLYICLRNLILYWKSVLLLRSRRCFSLQIFEIYGVYELFELSDVFVH